MIGRGLHLAVDLETLAVGAEASVAAIGWARFSARVDEQTVAWWKTKPPSLMRQLLGSKPFHDALVELKTAYDDCRAPGHTPTVWCFGASFDHAILQHLYASQGLTTPWSFRQERCARTAAAQLPELPKNCGQKHDAEDDACWAASIAIETWRRERLVRGLGPAFAALDRDVDVDEAPALAADLAAHFLRLLGVDDVGNRSPDPPSPAPSSPPQPGGPRDGPA